MSRCGEHRVVVLFGSDDKARAFTRHRAWAFRTVSRFHQRPSFVSPLDRL